MESDKAVESSGGHEQTGLHEGRAVSSESQIRHSPFHLFWVTAAGICITEILIMLILFRLPEMPEWVQALVDGFLLTLLLFPMLYFTLFRPMQLYIGELSRAGKRLQSEIAERRQIEQALLESERDLRHLSSELLATQERERGRVSRELHEELGQSLAAVTLGLRAINKDWRQASPEARDEWEKSMKAIDQVIENVRRISRTLGPSLIEDFGLIAALQRHAHSLMKNSGIQVSVDLTDVDFAFEQKTQVIIYRLLEEALRNVEQHAAASHVTITVRQEDGQFVFCVDDDGVGFDTNLSMAGAGAHKGLGMETMMECARMVGGRLEIRSEEGKGTRATLKVSIERTRNPVPQ